MDSQIHALIAAEYARQQHELELIASENYVSLEVMQTYGNVFTNKYSEGNPGKRYYGGQKWVDRMEVLTQHRALRMFGVVTADEPDCMTDAGYAQAQKDLASASRWVNVQPLSWSPANAAVYLGVLKPGDTILGMDLAAGGHLSHGHPLNISGIYFHIASYGVHPETLRIDYDEIKQKALASKPALILAWFSAYPGSLDWVQFAAIADAVEKEHHYRPLLMADIAHIAGLIAGGALASPFPYMDIVTTTTHKTLRWPRGALIYYRNGKLKRNNTDFVLEKSINRGVFPGIQWWPHEHIVAAKAVAFAEVLQPSFRDYARKIIENAQTLAGGLHDLGRRIITDGTENHLLLLDATSKTLPDQLPIAGKEAEHILESVGISCNKNMLPFDTRPPMDPSGIRLGTPAITTRWLWLAQMLTLAQAIDTALLHHADETKLDEVRATIAQLCKEFPLVY